MWSQALIIFCGWVLVAAEVRNPIDPVLAEYINEAKEWDRPGHTTSEGRAPRTKRALSRELINVSTLLNPPYLMKIQSDLKFQGNDQYEGYVVDLLAELSNKLGFQYLITPAPDGRYGSLNEDTGKWNGMIGELQSKRADLALADLTVTPQRMSIVDFSDPIMNFSISMVYRRDEPMAPSLTTFLKPFTKNVWFEISTAHLVISLFLFFLTKWLSQKQDEKLTFGDSSWNALGWLVRQPTGYASSLLSVRMLSTLWWMFAFFLGAWYIASLSAYLTIGLIKTPPPKIKDIVWSPDVTIGAVRGGSTSAFFRSSDDPLHQRISSIMLLTPSTTWGIEKLSVDPNHLQLVESTTAEYLVNRQCDLAQIGMIGSNSYSIGFLKGYPHVDQFNQALSELHEEGKLSQLRRKWWSAPGDLSCKRTWRSTYTDLEGQGLDNIGGLFLVLIVGLIIVSVIGVVEKSKNKKATDKSNKNGTPMGKMESEP